MKKIALLASLALAAYAAPAAAGDFDLTFQGSALQVDADADFINDDKLDNEISGVLTGVDLGAEYTFGDERGFVVGAHYFTAVGDGIVSEPIRNGNYLVHHTTLDGLSGWDVRAGYDFGALTFYAGYGQLERDVTTYQSCPEDSDAVPFGYCGNATFRQQREGLRGGAPEEDTADLTRVGLSWSVTERVFVSVDYAWAEFGQSITPLDVISNAENNAAGNREPHGPTSLAQDFNVLSFGAGVRF